MSLTHDLSHVNEARARLLEQYKTNQTMLALIDAFSTQTQVLEDSMWSLQTLRTIAASVGTQLDLLGTIVGLPRLGLDDNTYRVWLGGQILANSSKGDPVRLIEIASVLVNGPVQLIEDTTKIATLSSLVVAPFGLQVEGLLQEARAGGNRLIFEWWSVDPAFAFLGSADGEGFGTSFDTWAAETGNLGVIATFAKFLNALWLVGGISGGLLSTSPDAKNWTAETTNFPSGAVNDAAYGAGVWVIVGNAGHLSSSPDGTTWTLRTSQFGSNAIKAITFADGIFVAVGAGGNISTSTNGTTWTSRQSSGNDYNAITFGHGSFCAVGASGRISTSPDGITWTDRTSSTSPNTLSFVAFGTPGFVAAGNGANVTHSVDGINWTSADTGFGIHGITDLVWAPDQSLYVVVGAAGKLATSPDMITWTLQTSSFGTTDIFSIATGEGGARATGDLGKVAKSSDLITWTQQTSIFDAFGPLTPVGNGNGAFVAIDDTGQFGLSYDTGFGGTFASAKG